MSSGGIHITGVHQVMRAIGKAKVEDARKIDDALTRICGVVLRKAIPYTPIETGALRESGRIEVTGKGFAARGEVVFGGPTAHYALYVHEDMTKKHVEPTQAKFLERAARETRGTAASILQRTMLSGTYREYDGEIEHIGFRGTGL